MHIAFAILAHNEPDLVVRLIKRVTIDQDITIVLHWDKNASDDALKKIIKETKNITNIVLAERVHCAWGEWSLVQAQLNMIEALKKANIHPDYFYLLSGVDYPIRPIAELKEFLNRNYGEQYIEAVDITEKKWIHDGLNRERYFYRFYFNFKNNNKLWTLNYKLQKIFARKRRKLPNDYTPHMGSQWSCLTWDMCLKALDYSKNKNVQKFYKTVWIPDELFFPTFVANNLDKTECGNKNLTYYQFTGKGVPFVYCNDHFDFLIHQPAFFARKFSNYAHDLRNDLDEVEYRPELCFYFDDAIFGFKSKFLKEFDVNQSFIPKNKQNFGLVKKECWGLMDSNDKPYFIITGNNLAECKKVADWINEHLGNQFIAHNDLFNLGHVGFYKNQDEFCGYKAKDNYIPQVYPLDFLGTIIAYKPDHITGFIYTYQHNFRINDLIHWDSLCYILHIESDGQPQTLNDYGKHNEHLKDNPYYLYDIYEDRVIKDKLSSYVAENNGMVDRIYWINSNDYQADITKFLYKIGVI